MAKNFSTLRSQMSPEAQARSRESTGIMMEALADVRQHRQVSQEQLALALAVKQAAVSKLERRSDMYVSSLRSYIAALGGELEISARFPEGVVRIAHFDES